MGRIKWIDASKGLGVLAVAMGHILIVSNQYTLERVLMYLIYSFHMPFFFILSGFTLDCNKPSKKFLQSRIGKIGIPYLFLCFMDFIVMYIKEGQRYVASISIVDTILGTVNSTFAKLWFLVVIIFSLIGVYFIERDINNRIIKNLIMILLPIINRVCYYKGVFLPFSLEVCFLAIPFIYWGYKLKQDFRISWKWIILSTITYIVGMGIYIWLGYPIISVYDSNISNVFLYLVQGGSASYLCIAVIQKIVDGKFLRRVVDIFAALGKESLYIYGIHYYYLEVWSNIARVENLTKFGKYMYDIGGVFFSVMLSFFTVKAIRNIYEIGEKEHKRKRDEKKCV